MGWRILGKLTNSTEMIRGNELPAEEAIVVKESAWLFFPQEILLTLAFAN